MVPQIERIATLMSWLSMELWCVSGRGITGDGGTYTLASVQVVPVTESGLTDVLARASRAGRAVAVAARSAMRRVDGCMVVEFVLFV